MAYKRIAAVTGANKGIGLAIVRQLALQYPQSPMKGGPLLVYLTARDKARGEAAVDELSNDAQLKKAKALAADGGLTDVKYHQLDISETKSIQEFSSFLKKNHADGIDIVINNAAIAMQGFNSDVVKKTLDCNYYGTLEAIQDLLPLVRRRGRLVNVSSIVGMLNKYSPVVEKRFRAAKSVGDITSIMDDFKAAVAAGGEKEQGFPSAAYAVSKAGLTGVTKVIAEEQKAKGSKVLINSCCPGYVQTDMSKGGGTKTPDQGAQTPVMLALEDIGGLTGLFWRSKQVIHW